MHTETVLVEDSDITAARAQGENNALSTILFTVVAFVIVGVIAAMVWHPWSQTSTITVLEAPPADAQRPASQTTVVAPPANNTTTTVNPPATSATSSP